MWPTGSCQIPIKRCWTFGTLVMDMNARVSWSCCRKWKLSKWCANKQDKTPRAACAVYATLRIREWEISLTVSSVQCETAASTTRHGSTNYPIGCLYTVWKTCSTNCRRKMLTVLLGKLPLATVFSTAAMVTKQFRCYSRTKHWCLRSAKRGSGSVGARTAYKKVHPGLAAEKKSILWAALDFARRCVEAGFQRQGWWSCIHRTNSNVITLKFWTTAPRHERAVKLVHSRTGFTCHIHIQVGAASQLKTQSGRWSWRVSKTIWMR